MARQSQLQRMSLRILTLLCAVLIAAVHYGMRVWLLCLSAVIGSMVSEFSCLYLRGKPYRLWHLEAAADGLILTLLMPASVPYHTLIISCIGANIIGRHILGGEEKPLMPTAAIGWCISACGWQESVMTYPTLQRLPLFSCAEFVIAENRSVQWQEVLRFKGELPEWLAYSDGLPMGSGSLLLLLVAAVVLCVHKAADRRVLLGMSIPIAAAMILHGIYGGWSAVCTALAAYTMCGATMFSVIWLAADTRLSLTGILGVIYGCLIAISGMLPFSSQLTAVVMTALFAPFAIAAQRSANELQRKETASDGTKS